VTVLLDENFPLALYRQLRADGIDAEHIITIGWRGQFELLDDGGLLPWVQTGETRWTARPIER
jgi:hypothetical protein